MKYRILIVEDNIMLAGQQKKRLEKSGYEAEITIDEPGARKLLKKESFDLVLSDVRLPEGDGISLLEWMRKERMDIPFIIMTGYASVPDAVQAIKLGAKDYLAKPVQMDELQRQLKDIFRPKSVTRTRICSPETAFRCRRSNIWSVQSPHLTFLCLYLVLTVPEKNRLHSVSTI